MVGLKLFNPNYLGLVTVIAALFAAAVVNGERGVIFDTEHEADIHLQCDESSSNSWKIDFDEKDSPNKKIFKLLPESKGCFKSRKPIALNSSKFVMKFHSDSPQEESGNLVVRLVPLDGPCEEKDCVWEVSKDPQYKKGEWVTAEHTFPLKSTKKGYYVQLQADKLKGKFLLESLSFPDGISNYLGEKEPLEMQYANGTSAPSSAAKIGDFGKNLLFTTASVLTLNNLLN